MAGKTKGAASRIKEKYPNTPIVRHETAVFEVNNMMQLLIQCHASLQKTACAR